MRSRKVLPSFTGRRDLAFSRPMEVPRPPLSLRTVVLERSDWSSSAEGVAPRSSSRRGRDSTGLISASGIIPLSPPASASKLSLKAETAASESPAARIFASIGSNEGAMAE